jgi:hypothetical protein
MTFWKNYSIQDKLGLMLIGGVCLVSYGLFKNPEILDQFLKEKTELAESVTPPTTEHTTALYPQP